MAAIGRLPDTLADRCIVVRMQRKAAHQRCERLKELAAEPLRRQCARLVLDQARLISTATPEIPAELHDRAGDVWEPLLVLADLAGEGWPEKARRAALGLTSLATEHSPIGALLLDLLVLFVRDGSGRLHSRPMVEYLNTNEDRPWADALKGKVITQHWLARQLSSYGIRPKTLWIGDTSAKGYLREDFREAFQRYIPRSEVEALQAAQAPPPQQDAPGELPPERVGAEETKEDSKAESGI